MTATLVIDMQEKYIDSYEPALLSRVNSKIRKDYENKKIIIYIKNCGRRKKGEQYRLVNGLLLVSDLIYEKIHPSAFTSEKIVNALEKMKVDELEIIGVDGSCCIARTAIDAVEMGYIVKVYMSCVGARNSKVYAGVVEKMRRKGIIIV